MNYNINNIIGVIAISTSLASCTDSQPVVILSRSNIEIPNEYSHALKASVKYIADTLQLHDTIIIVFQNKKFFMSESHIAYITKKNPNIIYVRDEYIGNDSLPIILSHEIRHIWQYIRSTNTISPGENYDTDPLEIDARTFQLKYGVIAQKVFFKELLKQTRVCS